jgi:hypothetical protein
MIKRITFKEEPNLFNDIVEMSIDENLDHRRGSNFYRYEIIEFKPEDKEYYPEVENFEQYFGTWMTNTVIWDDNNGFEDEYSELTRVEKKEVISYEWVAV